MEHAGNAAIGVSERARRVERWMSRLVSVSELEKVGRLERRRVTVTRWLEVEVGVLS